LGEERERDRNLGLPGECDQVGGKEETVAETAELPEGGDHG
jgi:hypothetical protein